MDAEGVEGFFHRCEAFRRDDVGARDEKMGRGVDLVALEGVVPEAALPALTVDDRELNRRGEAFEVFVEGEGLEELLGVRGAVGLDEKHAAGPVLELFQCREEFVARPAADTITIQRGNFVNDSTEPLGVDSGVLVVIDQKRRAESLGSERRNELLEEGGFPGSEEADDDDERCAGHD
jgi:hypothetical protein